MSDDIEGFRVGDTVPPPYYFGALPEGLTKSAFEDPFNTDGWIDHCRQLSRKLGIAHSSFLCRDMPRWRRALASVYSYARSRASTQQVLLSGSACPRYLQPVAGLIRDIHLRRGTVSVLDIGGGFGDNFFELSRILDPDCLSALRYQVVDNEPSCRLGNDLFADYEVKPSFTSDHASLQDGSSIVLLVGTLQYLPSWRVDLASIAARASEYLFIARSPMSDGPSFTTTQLICPAYGSHAGKNLGATRINVVGVGDLRNEMSKPDWQPMFELLDADYSAQFARLPTSRRKAAYYLMAWSRSRG